MSDRAWLAEYADTKSAAAFARLVREHGPLVYSTCLREVRDRHLAEDVAQVVFVLLARKLQAGSWRPRTVLAGWLYETARFASRNALRRERRRRARETKAVIDMLGSRAAATGREGAGGSPRWEEIEPLLHKALGRLRPKDRDAILLRYYQDKPLKVVGASLGISVDAAQARVARVLEKLRQSLSRSGVVVSVATFAELLRANAEAPVPSGLVEGVVEALAHRAGTSAGGTVVVASRVDLLTDGVARAMVLLAVQKIVAVVACATVLASAVVAANRDERDPAALALLEKFGEGQAKLQSFIVRSEDTSHWAGGVTEAPPVTSTGQSVNEFRADARTGRFARRSAHRGDARPDATLDAGADGDYTRTVWDGRALYAYSRSDPGTPDRLTIVRGPYDGDAAPLERLEREVRTGYAGAATMGYFHLDEVRIDRAAKRASYIRLRPDREAVNGVDCQVIEMCTDGGNYTLWIDPEHGFHIVRAHVMKLPGDVVSGPKLEKGCRIRHVVEITRFEQVDGVWVPMEAKEEVDRIFPASPTPAQRGSMTHKKTLVKLNPDFDASGAFKLDDVRDGTLVSESAPGGTVKRAVWKGGVLEPLSF